MIDTNTREWYIHMARVYMREAKARFSYQRGYSFLLLEWAGKCRRKAFLLSREPKQQELFT